MGVDDADSTHRGRGRPRVRSSVQEPLTRRSLTAMVYGTCNRDGEGVNAKGALSCTRHGVVPCSPLVIPGSRISREGRLVGQLAAVDHGETREVARCRSDRVGVGRFRELLPTFLR